MNLLTVAVSAPTTTACTLQISAAHLEKTLPSRRLGSVVWRWRAPVRAPKGVWTFTATCREGASWAASWYKGEMGFPARSGALLGAPAEGTPSAGESCDSQGVCFARDPFPTGQCTWYAAGRRPDLIGMVHGAAGEWLREAKGRVPEGSRPAVGAIAVYAPDTPGTPGHVGYVAANLGLASADRRFKLARHRLESAAAGSRTLGTGGRCQRLHLRRAGGRRAVTTGAPGRRGRRQAPQDHAGLMFASANLRVCRKAARTRSYGFRAPQCGHCDDGLVRAKLFAGQAPR